MRRARFVEKAAMQLTCPNCGARYRIDASDWPMDAGPDEEPVFRPRRARCKVCRSVWSAVPEEEVLELDDPLPPDEEHPRLADAAWPAVGGWPEPRPVIPPPAPQPDFKPALDRPPPVFTPSGFTPPKDPAGAIYAAPPRPAIHFESPPVPVPMGDRPLVRSRLPGPGAGLSVSLPEALPEPELESAPPEPDEPEAWDEDEYEEPRRRWPWVLALLLLIGAVALALLWTGRVRPQDYGLPPFDPTVVGLPGVQVPNVRLPQVDVPDVKLPRTPPPPLALEAAALRRALPGGRTVWEISGTVRNPTAKAQAVPPVEIRLLDAGGQTVARWTVRPEAASVAAGGAVRFETSAIDPPASAVKLKMLLKPGELGRL
ncbi:DUF3426 domain-containing protein [Sandaracinobacter neustonicus]|uniref:DUF3426 domain-containing protein n=1 Tax=Sandaracinobacter neustonicus TaxID=1715348 RepID=A0A501XDJ6_9SPHN|nr:DUF3426 domain-containing protein [Sandaracinobacter neustonicus]TPE58602.1 DUF3426 domain-containing protein [Sandaracinobacter neustonicus]